MTSSITVEPYETVEFPDSDTDSWQVVDPFDSDNDDVITTESDVVSSSDEGEDVDDEEEDEDEDEDVDIADVITSESDVISSDEDEEEEEDDENEDDDVITSEEEEEDDVIVSEDDVDEITNHTQELNKGYELDRLINGEGGAPYNVEISDVMKEDAYFEHMQLQQRMLDEDDVEEQEEEEEEEDEDEDEDEDEYDEDLDDELVPRWLNNKFERQRMRKLGKKVYPKMKKSKRMVNQYNRPGCAGAKHGLGLNNNLVW